MKEVEINKTDLSKISFEDILKDCYIIKFNDEYFYVQTIDFIKRNNEKIECICFLNQTNFDFIPTKNVELAIKEIFDIDTITIMKTSLENVVETALKYVVPRCDKIPPKKVSEATSHLSFNVSILVGSVKEGYNHLLLKNSESSFLILNLKQHKPLGILNTDYHKGKIRDFLQTYFPEGDYFYIS